MTRKTFRHVATLSVIGATSLALSACGGDDESVAEGTVSASQGNSGLAVVAEDISFPEDTYQAAAGDVAVTYENGGSIGHTLVIDGVDGFKLTVGSKGDVDRGSVQLDPGTYELYCDVPGHRDGGMEAVLEVR